MPRLCHYPLATFPFRTSPLPRGKGGVTCVTASDSVILVATARGYLLRYSWDENGCEKVRQPRGRSDPHEEFIERATTWAGAGGLYSFSYGNCSAPCKRECSHICTYLRRAVHDTSITLARIFSQVSEVEVVATKQVADHRITAVYMDPWADHTLVAVRGPAGGGGGGGIFSSAPAAQPSEVFYVHRSGLARLKAVCEHGGTASEQ
jgi:hypothetical protein